MKVVRTILATMLISMMLLIPSSGSEVIISTEQKSVVRVVEPTPMPVVHQLPSPSSTNVIIEPDPVTEIPTHNYSEKDIELLSRITMAEAENQSELGKRLVIDTILNRVDSGQFPDTVEGVIFQKNQFSPISDGRWERCYMKPDIRQLVIEELENRTNSDVIFFRTKRYSKYGTPLFKEDDHYFSSN